MNNDCPRRSARIPIFVLITIACSQAAIAIWLIQVNNIVSGASTIRISLGGVFLALVGGGQITTLNAQRPRLNELIATATCIIASSFTLVQELVRRSVIPTPLLFAPGLFALVGLPLVLGLVLTYRHSRPLVVSLLSVNSMLLAALVALPSMVL
jgi:hypothetical protein